MKEYLKMADVFVNDVWACFNGHSDAAKCAANAISTMTGGSV